MSESRIVSRSLMGLHGPTKGLGATCSIAGKTCSVAIEHVLRPYNMLYGHRTRSAGHGRCYMVLKTCSGTRTFSEAMAHVPLIIDRVL